MTGIYQTTAPEPAPRPFNMAAYVLGKAEALAAKPALELHGPDNAEIWDFDRLRRTVAEVAAGFTNRGLSPGDRVLMRLGNTIDFPVVFLACLWAGLVAVPTSAALTRREADWIARDIAPRLCVGTPDLPLPADVPVAAPAELRLAGSATGPRMGDPDRLGYVIYTSGSTGTPRAVAHAHRAIWARRMMYHDWYGLRAQDRVCHAGAFNWTYTLGVGLMDPWAVGATALIRDPSVPNAALATLLSRTKATIFAAAPGVYRQILKADTLPDMPDLRHGLSAGEALGPQLRNTWRDRTGLEIYEALGMSECSTYVSAHPGRQAPPGTAGFVQRGRRVTVLGPDGTPQPFGTPGTLGIDRDDPGLMLGYLGDPAATEARFRGGWFDTGDRATLTADGTVTFLGREDDMMNAGGFRVAPLEVEAAFASLPGVADCAAVAVRIKQETEVIALVYTGPAPLETGVLQAHAQERLARYKQPRLFRHRDALPRTPNGKLNRKALREEFEAAT